MPNMCQKCVTLQKSMLWNGQGWWVNSMTSPSFLPPLSCWCLPLINFNQKRESKKTPLIQTLEIGLMKHWPDQSRQTWRKRINSRKASQLYNHSYTTSEPGGLQSMGSHRVCHDWMTEHACMLILNVRWELHYTGEEMA